MSDQRFKITRNVSIISAVVNALLAISKIAIGIVGQSQALVADGIHSVSDVLSDGLVVFAAKAGGQLPDEEHPYGHQRIETIAVIIIALILFFVGCSILYPAVVELIQQKASAPPSLWVLITAIISIVANEGLFHYCFRKGKQIHSNLLISNAWHNRSDALVSLIVVFSVIGAYLGWHFLDGVGAAIIAVIIIKVALKMIWQSGNELIDAAVSPETVASIKHCIQNTPGVVSVHNLRTRSHGHNIFVDVHVEVAPDISVSEGHYIADQAEHAIKLAVAHIADVAIHIDPEDDMLPPLSIDSPSRQQIEQQLNNTWNHLALPASVDKMCLHYLRGKVTVEVLLKIPATQASEVTTIQRAYQQAALQLPDINDCQIYCHISE